MSNYTKQCLMQLQEDAIVLMNNNPNPEERKTYGYIWDQCLDLIWYGEPQIENLFETLN